LYGGWIAPQQSPNFTNITRRLACWLGVVSHRVSSNLSYWPITESGKVVSKASAEHITCDDYLQADNKLEIKTFNDQLVASLDNANLIINGEGKFACTYKTSMISRCTRESDVKRMRQCQPQRTMGTCTPSKS
jgi:hypothetical protein